ncbi:MAG: MFS transporter [Lutibacter sp.]
MDSEKKDLGFIDLMKSFPGTFWKASFFELFERFAWYGMFAILAMYLVASKDVNGLGFTDDQGGLIIGVVTGTLYFLPLITGAIADKIGYRKSLMIAFVILALGYFSLTFIQSYWAFFGVFMILGLGAAMFKPVASGIVARTTGTHNVSMGFGIFYMMVNIGGWIGPFVVGKLRGETNWVIAFKMATAVILINLIFVTFFYKDISKNEDAKQPLLDTVKQSFENIWNALKDAKLTVLLIIMIGFWTLFNQLFYTLPKYIQDWVNVKSLFDSIHSFSPFLASVIGDSDQGVAKPELLVNLDAFAIIFFQILISYIVIKWRSINAMITGLVIVTIGIGLAFYFRDGLFIILGIIVFAIGEMTTNPKFSAYIAEISPKGKEALYQGTYFLPVFVGNVIAGWISGSVYGKLSAKISLAQNEAIAKGISILDKNDHVVQYTKTGFKAVDNAGNILKNVKVDITKNEYINQVADKLHMTNEGLTTHLWNTYHPNEILYIFVGLGIVTFLSLLFYDKVYARKKRNA